MVPWYCVRASQASPDVARERDVAAAAVTAGVFAGSADAARLIMGSTGSAAKRRPTDAGGHGSSACSGGGAGPRAGALARVASPAAVLVRPGDHDDQDSGDGVPRGGRMADAGQQTPEWGGGRWMTHGTQTTPLQARGHDTKAQVRAGWLWPAAGSRKRRAGRGAHCTPVCRCLLWGHGRAGRAACLSQHCRLQGQARAVNAAATQVTPSLGAGGVSGAPPQRRPGGGDQVGLLAR